MVSTRKAPEPSADDVVVYVKATGRGGVRTLREAFPRELGEEVDRLQRVHGVDPTLVFRLLETLVSRYTYRGCDGQFLRFEVGELASVRQRTTGEENRRAGWKGWQGRAKLIDTAVSRMRGLDRRVSLGGPRLRRCPECGAETPSERVVWCASTCPSERADGKSRLRRIVDELEVARAIEKGATLKPLVPARGEGSALAWVSRVAPPLCEYLASVVRQDEDAPRVGVRPMAARILHLASGRKITPGMVTDRKLRAAGDK